MTYRIAPSILSADFSKLGEEIHAVLDAGADIIHFDVMDNHYVPNLTIGPLVLASLRRAGIDCFMDVHLMVKPVDRLIGDFIEAGADLVSIHPEATEHLHRTLSIIRESGREAGLVLNPATPLEVLPPVVDLIDLVLVMSVNPGFGGQRYIPTSTDKLRRARYLLDRQGHAGAELQVDGGMDVRTAPEAVAAGASCLVAGSAVFGHPQGVGAGIRALREALAAAEPGAARPR
jgi:ribulose-phosphate 3-epimerase